MPSATPTIDEATALAAFEARDKTMDGRFVVAVKSTMIYCRPSCPARRPRPDNVQILPSSEAARAAGYRECLRCKPDGVAPDRLAVERALAIMDADQGGLRLAELGPMVGYATHHFQRIFKRQVGITPAAYMRALRSKRLARGLDQNERITDAIYEAGYEAPSRAYVDARSRLGMTPSAWKRGGEGVAISYAIAATSLGDLLVAATEKGLCRISFDQGEADLQAQFPRAIITHGGAEFEALVKQVVALVDDPARPADLPIDVVGTAFQEAVWAALKAIPAGETRTYKELAETVGNPAAVRAAGSACGGNALAVLIPCHRVLRSNGELGGYAYGIERKKALLARERGAEPRDDASKRTARGGA